MFRVNNILERYSLDELRTQPSHLLSGGHKQLLALASVLVMEPEYIVLDEPTTLLDLKNKHKIIRMIHELNQTVLLISHDLTFLDDFDRVIVFEDGQVIMDGKPNVALPFYIKNAEEC